MDLKEMLERAMNKVERGETCGYMIPLGALDSMVSLSAELEPPGHFRVMLTTGGEEKVRDVFSREQVLTTILPLLLKNERLIQLKARLFAAQVEKFLKELAASE
jgi:hypothetical protein